MTQRSSKSSALADARLLRRALSGGVGWLEVVSGSFELHRGGSRRMVDAALVATMERAGQLMRLPDGRVVLSEPAARRRLTQATIAGEAGERLAVTLNAAESPLGWLGRRREFDAPLIAAAERLRLDYTRAHMEPRVTAQLDGFIPSGTRGRSAAASLEPPEFAIAAKHRFFAALDAVGPELAGILAEICCLTAGLEQAERALSLPVRSGKAILHLALTRLARHYGFLAPEKAGERHRAIRNWRAA